MAEKMWKENHSEVYLSLESILVIFTGFFILKEHPILSIILIFFGFGNIFVLKNLNTEVYKIVGKKYRRIKVPLKRLDKGEIGKEWYGWEEVR